MISSLEEGPSTILRLSFERKIPVKESSRTETTQLSSSNESCEELRHERFDETAVSISASL